MELIFKVGDSVVGLDELAIELGDLGEEILDLCSEGVDNHSLRLRVAVLMFVNAILLDVVVVGAVDTIRFGVAVRSHGGNVQVTEEVVARSTGARSEIAPTVAVGERRSSSNPATDVNIDLSIFCQGFRDYC